ncbi:hypothetical protein [Salinithrix halophila]|uniref:Uncharacterized protein n=1 Tax=Salinithrix halophila TaxID=1485204 RepID=A0ABV8JCT6_9BACL
MEQTTTASVPSVYQQAALRWKQGHHVFHVVLVTMNTMLEASMDALKQRDWPRLTASLDRLTALYKASTSTMKYAADFPVTLYEELIRPSMMPPFISPGFSGELNTEHTMMLEGFQHLRSRMKEELGNREQWPTPVAKSWTRLLSAQAYSRKHHALVCQKFVKDGASLLKDFYANKKETEKDGLQ